MDIVTQGIIGAIASQSAAPKGQARRALTIGFLSGLPADVDILIRSTGDPLLTLEFHRQFSHSLLFIPVGGVLCGLLIWPFFRRCLSLSMVILLSTAAYATSGLLDACTSYGTQLLWPFSDIRIAWSLISVFDPLFSLTLLALLGLGWWRNVSHFARLGGMFALIYLSVGFLQHQRAEQLAYRVAESDHSVVERLIVKPTMGNLLLWRAVYQSDGLFHIIAIRVLPFSEPSYRKGSSLPVWHAKDIPDDGITQESVVYGDIQRFLHFSDGFVAKHPILPNALGDVRYALLPHSELPLWGVTWSKEHLNQHVNFKNWRHVTPRVVQIFISMLVGSDPEFKPIDSSNLKGL